MRLRVEDVQGRNCLTHFWVSCLTGLRSGGLFGGPRRRCVRPSRAPRCRHLHRTVGRSNVQPSKAAAQSKWCPPLAPGSPQLAGAGTPTIPELGESSRAGWPSRRLAACAAALRERLSLLAPDVLGCVGPFSRWRMGCGALASLTSWQRRPRVVAADAHRHAARDGSAGPACRLGIAEPACSGERVCVAKMPHAQRTGQRDPAGSHALPPGASVLARPQRQPWQRLDSRPQEFVRPTA